MGDLGSPMPFQIVVQTEGEIRDATRQRHIARLRPRKTQRPLRRRLSVKPKR